VARNCWSTLLVKLDVCSHYVALEASVADVGGRCRLKIRQECACHGKAFSSWRETDISAPTCPKFLGGFVVHVVVHVVGKLTKQRFDDDLMNKLHD
jgi:hypothetical protein